MASGPITSWEIDGETVETVSDFILGGSKITAYGDCSHAIKRHLLPGRKVMTNRDSILKSRDIALPTKIRLVKDMVFSVWSCMDVRVGLWGKLSAEKLMAAMKLKMFTTWKVRTNLNSILKSRNITLSTKVHLVKDMVFPVVMYGCELDYKESWVLKNWCFWTVVLEKTLEGPLDWKEIQSSPS